MVADICIDNEENDALKENSMTENKNDAVRLNKYIAQCGICSRRDADKYIADGRVTVNGLPAESGMKITIKDLVKLDGKRLKTVSEKKVYAYYKPVGVACTERDAHAEKTVATEVKTPVRVTYAGRLDMSSSGLLILSNDGDLINAMMKGANAHEKEYVVQVDKDISGTFLKQMENGVYLEELDATTRKCKVSKMGKSSFRIILTQGLNRQIRRMCKSLGYNVRSLQRTRVMTVKLGDMKPGELREITGKEKMQLYSACGMRAED